MRMTRDTPSAALARIAPSPTVAMTARARALRAEGRDIIALSVGEPDFDTPDHICEAAIRAIRDGETRYTDVDGTPALKAAIAAKFARDNGLHYAPAEISVGTGGKQCLFNALLASIDPGDDVLVPAPYWVSYPDIVRLAGGTPRILACPPAQGYKLLPDQLADAIGPATRWLILNSPSNPTGALYSATELAALGDVLRRHPHVLVLTDDIYEHLRYTDAPFATIAQVCPDLRDRTLTLNGVSKGFAMTGWRIGFAGGPRWLIAAMAKLQSQSTTNPSAISQAAAVAALTGPQDFLAGWRASFAARRDRVVALLNAIPGVTCDRPDGAFYVYPDCAGLIGRTRPEGAVIDSDAALVDYWLEAAGVALVPGAAFGLSPAFRLSYAAAPEVLETACLRLAAATARIS